MKIYYFLIINQILFPLLAFAQNGFDLIQDKTLKILGNFIKFAFTLLMLSGSALLIYLGIKYIMAKEKVEELHRSLIYLILGLVLLITSFFLPNLIKNFIESSIQ